MKRLVKALFTFVLRLYFRRVEVFGEEHVPKKGPVIFVLNHHNALVDPLFILCLASRDVSFLAKSTLFDMPMVGYLTRAFDSIPVYRKQDGGDTSQNQKTFAMCHQMLREGKALALFPEGISHNVPKLMPLKSGTARIALGAASQGGEEPLQIVPAGLYFTQKFTFRSEALLYYGEPIEVKRVELDEQGEPPRDVTQELTQKMFDALTGLILEAQHEKALSIVQRAERIFSRSVPDKHNEITLTEELELRKQFVQAYEVLEEKMPKRLHALQDRVEQYESTLSSFGLETTHLIPQYFTPSKVFIFIFKRLILLPVLIPLACVGTLVHFPSYHGIGFLAKRMAKQDIDMLSTFKILGALLFFPLTWLLVGGAAWWMHSWQLGLLVTLLAPLTGWCANFFWEHFEDFKMRLRSFGLFLLRRDTFEELVHEQKSIRQELIDLGKYVRSLEA